MIPFHASALLPTEQRLTSPLFRRLRRFGRFDLDLHQGAELIAFVRLVGFKPASWIFGWRNAPSMEGAYRALLDHAPMVELADRMHAANLERMDEETAERLLYVLLESGWRRGNPPVIVSRYLQSLRERGHSAREIADHFRVLKRSQVQDWMQRRDQGQQARARRAKAGISLLIG